MGIDFEGLKNNDNTYGKRSSFNRWKPSAGENVVRILPPTMRYFKEDINYFSEVFNNHFVSLGKNQFEVFRCLRDHPETTKCPACTFFFKYKDNPKEELSQMAYRFNSSVRHIMNVIVVETEGGDAPEGVQVYECGPGVYDDIKLYAENKRYGDIFHPKEGRNMIIHLTPGKEHKTGRNQYNVNPDIDSSSVVHLLGDDWKNKINSLEDEVPEFPSEDYIYQVIETAAEIIGVDPKLPGRKGVVSPGTDVSPPKREVEDDPDDEFVIDDDDVFGDEDTPVKKDPPFDVDEDDVVEDSAEDDLEDEFEGLLDDDDLDF